MNNININNYDEAKKLYKESYNNINSDINMIFIRNLKNKENLNNKNSKENDYSYLNYIFDNILKLNRSCELLLIEICKLNNIEIDENYRDCNFNKINFYKLYDNKIKSVKDFYINMKITGLDDYNFRKINKFFNKYKAFKDIINVYSNDIYEIYNIKLYILNIDCFNKLTIFYQGLNNYIRYYNIINNNYYKNIRNIIKNIDNWKNNIENNNDNNNNNKKTIGKALKNEDIEYDIFDNFHDIFKNYINLILSINNIELTSYHDFEYKLIKCCQIYNSVKDSNDKYCNGNFIQETCNNMVNLFYFSKNNNDHIDENLFNILYNEVIMTCRTLENRPNRFYLE